MRREWREVGRQLRCFGGIEVAADSDEPAAERQEIECGAQVGADRAADLAGRGDDAIERAVLRQPLDCRFRPDLGDARHIVDGIADQRQIVDDARGRHAELGEDAAGVEHFLVHRVDQRDVLVDELRQILVAGRNDHVETLCRGATGQGADHVVGFDARDGQDRPAERRDARVDRFDLARQIVRHGRPVGLVFGIPVVAEGFSLGIEHASLVSYVLVLRVGVEAAQHVEDAVDGAGRFAARVAQIGQGVEGAVEIGRSVDQKQGWHFFGI